MIIVVLHTALGPENAINRAKSQLDFSAFTGHAMWLDMYEKAPETELWWLISI